MRRADERFVRCGRAGLTTSRYPRDDRGIDGAIASPPPPASPGFRRPGQRPPIARTSSAPEAQAEPPAHQQAGAAKASSRRLI